MDKREWRLIHLHHIKEISRSKLRKVINYEPDLEQIYHWKMEKWQELFKLSDQKAKSIIQQLNDKSIQRKVVQHVKSYNVMTIFSKSYPTSLKVIPDPPLVLYLQGNPSLLNNSPNLSVVGTRYPSKHALSIMNQILIPLFNYNFVITSGMAKGIDGFAHQLALQHNNPTIAVLGGGFHHIYPKENLHLFNELSKENLIISEYPPDQPPKKYHFPERNRIISGLSFGTLVIEAKKKSGTLITVDQALEQGKEVFAVPGSILAETSSGCNQLIQDGAKLIQTSNDILEECELTPSFAIKN
ncbi:DNA-processing protein DprA [Gracilibacillus kekensis]|uniref:DNA processing protein n=1 Tax=Gracilibacillus kekensis TaxID=1027249 RepID=A0A1M7PG65_9BACI|nr:DNA-processing protein DprA [Gracilibacillus kekensis]SHN16045.1 DNA processing protein [Gracilibacillus kekensis]